MYKNKYTSRVLILIFKLKSVNDAYMYMVDRIIYKFCQTHLICSTDLNEIIEFFLYTQHNLSIQIKFDFLDGLNRMSDMVSNIHV